MNIRFHKNREDSYTNSGFTLLEVMIAVVIFGFLMLYVSQLMHMEIRLFNTASKQNDVDHNSRAAMMHILDEIRLNPNAEKAEYITSPPPVKRYYYLGDLDDLGNSSDINKGVYYVFLAPDTEAPETVIEVTCCLINVNPRDPDSLPGPVIYLNNSELWYRDVNNVKKKISDQIQSVILSTEPDLENVDRLLKIEIIALDNSKLISWIRLY